MEEKNLNKTNTYIKDINLSEKLVSTIKSDTHNDKKKKSVFSKLSIKSALTIILIFVALIATIVTVIILLNNNINSQNNSTIITTQDIQFEGRYIDVHTHISTSGMSIDEIIRNMDSEGIDKMIIMKPPASIPVDTPQSNFGVPDVALQNPDRFYVLYGGEAIAMLENAAISGEYTKEEEERYITLLEEELKTGIYIGIGEIGLRHFVPTIDGKSKKINDLTIPGNHPWMFLMSDIAAKYDVPIDVHMEATTESIKGLEDLLDHNVNTKIIWDHAGWSDLATKNSLYSEMATPQLFDDLMSKHSNLYSSIKIRKEIVTSPISIFNRNSEIPSDWIQVLKKYPDRFMIGSDIKPGMIEDQFKMIKDTRLFLNQLPSEILKGIERENAEDIFKI